MKNNFDAYQMNVFGEERNIKNSKFDIKIKYLYGSKSLNLKNTFFVSRSCPKTFTYKPS